MRVFSSTLSWQRTFLPSSRRPPTCTAATSYSAAGNGRFSLLAARNNTNSRFFSKRVGSDRCVVSKSRHLCAIPTSSIATWTRTGIQTTTKSPISYKNNNGNSNNNNNYHHHHQYYNNNNSTNNREQCRRTLFTASARLAEKPTRISSSFDALNAAQADVLAGDKHTDRNAHIRVPEKLETRYWRIEGPLKVYKAVTPSLRNRRHPTRFHLHRGGPVKRLSAGKRSTGGRNALGRVTVRGRGGGHKRRLRLVDFVRTVPGKQRVVRLEYDPGRSAEIALLQHLSTGEFSYILCPDGLVPGDVVESFRGAADVDALGLSKVQILRPGNVLKLRHVPVGTTVHNISLKPDGNMILCRAAGTSAQVLSTSVTSNTDSKDGYAQVRLSSGEIRLVPLDSACVIGQVGNKAWRLRRDGKAGVSRWRGFRPITRGIAKNPVDHPHGGGYNSKGNKAPRSPWGWKTKGFRTVRRKKWYLIRRRTNTA